jgi:hypothetical protein
MSVYEFVKTVHCMNISVDRLVGSVDQPSIQVIFKATTMLLPIHS